MPLFHGSNMKKSMIEKLRRQVRKRKSMSAPRIIVIVFAVIILVGALLLTLPAASRGGKSCGFLTALFTATSATCVTGLSLVDTYVQWTGFGQAVILLLIQIGGLGFMTIMSVFFFVLRAKIGLRSRVILSQSFGMDNVNGVVRLVRHVLAGTLLFELAGAAVLTARFAGDQPFGVALRWGIFHSVSAFCNAGFDILGKIAPGASLMPYAADPVVNVTIMLLIVIGGLGFFVWEDLLRCRSWRQLSVYTKLVLLSTGVLILGGAGVFALLEWNNPDTLGGMATGEKLLCALFQSVTTRTAGFSTISQGNLTEASKAVTVVLMLIGGSSGSTAGGMKTVTVCIAVLSALAMLRGKNRVTVFRRSVGAQQVLNAISIVLLMTGLVVFGAVCLSAACGFRFLDAIYETASAIGTVGLTTGVTPYLPTAGKLLIIAYMFFGRIGIMTIGMGFLLGKREDGRYHYATTKLLIG